MTYIDGFVIPVKKSKPGETVFFSFVIYRSKAHRDAVNRRVMKEMQKTGKTWAMPFNPRRMAYAGFKTLVQG